MRHSSEANTASLPRQDSGQVKGCTELGRAGGLEPGGSVLAVRSGGAALCGGIEIIAMHLCVAGEAGYFDLAFVFVDDGNNITHASKECIRVLKISAF